MEDGDRVTEVEGRIVRLLPGGSAEVEMADGHCIVAEISAKIKVRFIGLRVGERVRCEISPYDSARVRIVGRVEKVNS